MAEQSTFVCPCCGRSNWEPGGMGVYRHTFVPLYRKFMWVGYAVRAFVCRDCGYLAQFLAMQDVEDIRQKAPRKPKDW